MKATRSLSALLLVAAAACVTFRVAIEDRLPPSVIRVLREPESLEILTLDPLPIEARGPALRSVPAERQFNGFEIREHVPLKDRDERHDLVALVFKGILESDGSSKEGFSPSLGLRAVREGQVVDLLMCYDCQLIDVIASAKSSRIRTSDVAAPIEALFRKHGLSIRDP